MDYYISDESLLEAARNVKNSDDAINVALLTNVDMFLELGTFLWFTLIVTLVLLVIVKAKEYFRSKHFARNTERVMSKNGK